MTTIRAWFSADPIELAFAKLKQLLRSAGHRTVDALWSDVQRMLDLITPADAANFLGAPARRFRQH